MDFFILNSKRVLNSVDFSPFTKAQNDNALLSLQVDFFAAATPCKPLGRYAQNDKNKPKARFVVILRR